MTPSGTGKNENPERDLHMSLVKQRPQRGGLPDVRGFSIVHTELDHVPFVFLYVEQPKVIQVLCYWRFSQENHITAIR
jgi:hypothetical protein